MIRILFVLCALSLSGCTIMKVVKHKKYVEDELLSDLESVDSYLEVTVTKDSKMDGCGYLLESSNGKIYNPTNLEKPFQKEGLILLIRYNLPKPAATICMTGKRIRLIEVKVKD